MANEFMDICNDELSELTKQLNASHLEYLQTDDCPEKIEQRKKLEGIISKFLCLVPHGNKFIFQETAHILNRSAATVQDFSAYRACSAWRALSLYAANLFSQPWRKEYRTLHTYSGYYKHHVDTNLVGAEVMFQLMGYKHTSTGVMTLDDEMDQGVDLYQVCNVSRDVIVAFVECQIMKQIWEGVSKQHNIGWLDIVEFREDYVLSPEQSIRALNQRCLQKMAPRNHHHIMAYCHQTPMMPEVMATTTPTTHPHFHPNPYTYAYNTGRMSNYSVPSLPVSTQQFQQHPTAVQNYAPALHNNPLIFNQHHQQAMFPVINNHKFENYCNPYSGYQPVLVNKYATVANTGIAQMYPNVPTTAVTTTHRRTVPTGQLIELEPASYNGKVANSSPEYDEIDSHMKNSRDYEKMDVRSIKMPHKDAQSQENWEYVFLELKSQNYSKDLGKRDNVLHHKAREPSKYSKGSGTGSRSHHGNSRAYQDAEEKKHARKQDEERETNRFHPGQCDSRPLASKENGRKITASQTWLPDTKRSLDWLDLDKKYDRNQSRGVTEILESMKINQASRGKVPEKELRGDDPEDTNWYCASCTYSNVETNLICEMCSKSRHKGNEDTPLASGGKQCPKCTLINEKDSETCNACTASLHDSPTYI